MLFGHDMTISREIKRSLILVQLYQNLVKIQQVFWQLTGRSKNFDEIKKAHISKSLFFLVFENRAKSYLNIQSICADEGVFPQSFSCRISRCFSCFPGNNDVGDQELYKVYRKRLTNDF